MTPSTAIQWRHTTRRCLCSPHDAARFPEALLAAVFERYYAITRAVARYGSTTPGLMENRRRMGKRQMAELNFGHSRPASPLWVLENLPDLTQWKWKPPSSPNTLFQRTRVVEERGIIQSLLNWFTGRADPASDMASGVAGQPLPKITWDSQTSPSAVVETGLNFLSRDLSTLATTETKPNFKCFCDNFKECLSNGTFSAEAICSILDGVQNRLAIMQSDPSKPLEGRIADRTMLRLLMATIQGLPSGRIHKYSDYSRFIWNDILQKTSIIQMNTLRAFSSATAKMPDRSPDDVPSLILNLNNYLLASGSGMKHSSMVRQASKMAKALKNLDLVNDTQILECGTQQVLSHLASEHIDFSQMRLGWLQVLARLPSVDFDLFAGMCSMLETGKDVKPISNKEICELYVARYRSTIVDAPTVANMLAQEIRSKDDFKYYGYLSMILWQTEQFDHVKSFCNFLEELGRDQDIMRLAKAFRNLIKNEARPLANIAIGARQPSLALEIISLYEKSRVDSKNFWGSPFSTKAMKLMMESRSLRQIEVLRMLRIRCLARGKRSNEVPTKIQVVKAVKAARAIAISPAIRPRVSLSLITYCINYLQRIPNAVIPVPALRALLHIVTRDLAGGGPGRTTRIRWILGLLYKHVGRDEMVRVGLGIRRWRELNKRRLLGKVG